MRNGFLQPEGCSGTEISYFSLDKRAAQCFFQLVSQPYLKGSIILTSNKSYGEWGSIFSNTVLAAAILDH